MLLRGLLVDRRTWGLRVAAGDLLGLPNEVLDEVALVLREKEDLRLLDDDAKILNELVTLRRELLRRLGQRL